MKDALTSVSVDDAPKAIGPYAQGVVANGLLFTAGQVPFDPATMKIVEGDIAVQTARAYPPKPMSTAAAAGTRTSALHGSSRRTAAAKLSPPATPCASTDANASPAV